MASGGGSGDFSDEIGDITSKTEKLDVDEYKSAGYVAFILNSKGITRDNDFKERKGAHKDKEYFENIFVNKLGLDWINEKKYENLKVSHWDHSIMGGIYYNSESDDCCLRCNILSQNKDYNSCRFFVLVASSHGVDEQEPKILMSDGSSLMLSEITEVLRDVRLANVMKILILQACRTDISEVQPSEGEVGGATSGNQDKGDDQGVHISVRLDIDRPGGNSSNRINEPEGEDQDSAPPLTPSSKDPAPIAPSPTPQTLSVGEPPLDFMIVYATTKGRRVYHHEQKGSWMLECMDEVISKVISMDSVDTQDRSPSKDYNFMKLLTKANGLVCKREKEQYLRDEGGGFIKRDGKRVRDEDKRFKNTMCVTHRLRDIPVFDLGVAASRLEERRRQLPTPGPINKEENSSEDSLKLERKKKKKKRNLPQ